MGESTTISWQVARAISCEASGGTESWRQSGISLPSGNKTIDVLTEGGHLFTFTCSDAVGGVSSANVTVTGSQPVYCNPPSLAGSVTAWSDISGSVWPLPSSGIELIHIPTYGYRAIEFNTGGVLGNGGFSSIEAVGTRGGRLGSISKVRRTDGSAQILVDEQSTASGTRELFFLKNKGLTKFIINNLDGAEWAFANKGTSFRISRQGSGKVELEVFSNGDATLAGVLTKNSDVNSKQDIVPVDGSNVLEKLRNLEISEWSYKDAPDDRHVGPMAQDFHAGFGLGNSDKGIATLDSSGIALAAIKALIDENTSLRNRLSVLKINRLKCRLSY